MAEPIYVERAIRGQVDDIWERTQDPDQHERWDLRFTDIEYLPRDDPDEPQEFEYRTRIGFGLAVSGTGTSVATNDAGEETTSVLEFRSDDPKSLIEEGRGFWRYVETDEGNVRFLTEYTYETRWGRLGRLIDRVAFRPLLGWATAWSFDALGVWLEDGVPPEVSIRTGAAHALIRLALAFVWVYQGVVPKLLARHPDELALVRGTVPFAIAPETVMLSIGVAEVAFGLALLAFWRERRLLLVAAILPLALFLPVLVAAPETILAPFNPVALNLTLAALAAAGYLIAENLPTATACRRERASA